MEKSFQILARQQRRVYMMKNFVVLVACFSIIVGAFGPVSLVHQRFLCSKAEICVENLSFTRLNERKKNLSASERERRDEEFRRKERKDEVVIGKTSAKKGEKDFSLNPKATEEEWLRLASNVEKEVFRLTEAGMESLNSLQLEEANKAYGQVFELRPNAYLWQAGIVKFYLGHLEEAADIFARSAEIFESKFGAPASEERIWRDACELKFLNSMARQGTTKSDRMKRAKTFLRCVKELEGDGQLPTETRKVIRISRDLFSSSVDSNYPEELLARAKLRSICGKDEKPIKVDRKMWKLSSWFYLGLHYDAKGDTEESKRCMKMALRLCPSSGKSNDIIHTLPLLHMSVRDWFDDDDFDDDPMAKPHSDMEHPGFSPAQPSYSASSMAYSDPFIEESIKGGVEKMKLTELREALRLRGLKTTGSKESLQERLFYSLMDDAGFNCGFAP